MTQGQRRDYVGRFNGRPDRVRVVALPDGLSHGPFNRGSQSRSLASAITSKRTVNQWRYRTLAVTRGRSMLQVPTQVFDLPLVRASVPASINLDRYLCGATEVGSDG